jgi:hypothetical protein
MAMLSCARLDERIEAVGPVRPEPLLGTWLNTNSATQDITKAILTEKDSQVVLHVMADNRSQLADWGEAAGVFASDSGATEGHGLQRILRFWNHGDPPPGPCETRGPNHREIRQVQRQQRAVELFFQ